MVTARDEIERKHDGGRLTAATFSKLPKVAGVRGPRHDTLDAVYHDTEDLRLYASGITVRRRTGGEDAGWHAKLPVNPEHRREVHAPLTASTEEVPGELTESLAAYTAGRPLRPCAHISTERYRWQLVDRHDLFSALRLLSMSERDKDTEILLLRHQVTLRQRQLGDRRVQATPTDRILLAALLTPLPWRSS